MSQLDDLLAGLLGGTQGGSGGAGGIADVLSGLTGGKGGAGGGGLLAALVPIIGGLLANGGLNKVLAGFQKQGQSAQADSWVGTGANEPVSGSDVRQAIGDDEISAIAAKLGLSEEETADVLAEALPQVVDRVSPEGSLPADDELDRVFGRLAAAPGQSDAG